MICKGSSAFRLKNMGFLHNTVETLIFKLFLIRDRYKPLSLSQFFLCCRDTEKFEANLQFFVSSLRSTFLTLIKLFLPTAQ